MPLAVTTVIPTIPITVASADILCAIGAPVPTVVPIICNIQFKNKTTMKKQLFYFLLLSLPLQAWAAKETVPEWRNQYVNQQNREARRANFFAFESEQLAKAGDKKT